MKNRFKRVFFYFSPLGRKILKDYFRLSGRNLPGNFSCDPNIFISFSDIQWSIAHRINIYEEEENMFLFLIYVRHGFYINNPKVHV